MNKKLPEIRKYLLTLLFAILPHPYTVRCNQGDPWAPLAIGIQYLPVILFSCNDLTLRGEGDGLPFGPGKAAYPFVSSEVRAVH